MRLFGSLASLGLVSCLCVTLAAQQPPSSSQSATVTSGEQTATQPPPSATATTNSESEKKPESKVKRKLNDLVPYCVGIGSIGKCRHDSDADEERRKEQADFELRQRCKIAAQQPDTEAQRCTDLRKRDAAHDVEVGDTYLDEKSYTAAESRYREALRNDPTNATAMLHLAQVFEKTHRSEEAMQQYRAYLQLYPDTAEAKKAQAALQRLQKQEAKR